MLLRVVPIIVGYFPLTTNFGRPARVSCLTGCTYVTPSMPVGHLYRIDHTSHLFNELDCINDTYSVTSVLFFKIGEQIQRYFSLPEISTKNRAHSHLDVTHSS